jgi:CRP-like cAMP-binding protein
MTDEEPEPMTDDDGLRARFTRQGEETLGKFAQELLENPLVTSALSRAFEAREKATQAQEVAMGALNLPSAADLERLTRRLRSVSQRLEGIEDGLDRVEARMEDLDGASRIDERLAAIEEQVTALAGELRERLPAPDAAPPRSQERMPVEG